jgi:hypothetical protein
VQEAGRHKVTAARQHTQQDTARQQVRRH